MNKRTILIILIIFSSIGIIISSMLTLAKYNDQIALLCGQNPSNDCNTVQNSNYSNLFTLQNKEENTQTNVPLTLAGLLYYTTVFGISITLIRKNTKQKTKNIVLPALFVISIIGLSFSIIYTLIQAMVINAFCTYCLISAFDTLIIFILTSYLLTKN